MLLFRLRYNGFKALKHHPVNVRSLLLN